MNFWLRLELRSKAQAEGRSPERSCPPIKLSLEENIGQLTIEDEDTYITGRFDLLAVNQERVDPVF